MLFDLFRSVLESDLGWELALNLLFVPLFDVFWRKEVLEDIVSDPVYCSPWLDCLEGEDIITVDGVIRHITPAAALSSSAMSRGVYTVEALIIEIIQVECFCCIHHLAGGGTQSWHRCLFVH